MCVEGEGTCSGGGGAGFRERTMHVRLACCCKCVQELMSGS